MDLIKKIKQAEIDGKEIIEQAKIDAARQAEQMQLSQEKKHAHAKQERIKATEAAVATAQSQGLAEIENLKAQAGKKRQQLRDNISDKTNVAVAKVTEYLKG